MEIKVCNNCKLIDEIIGNKINKFDKLSVKNLGLHCIIMKSREQIIQLQTEIFNLQSGIKAEQHRGFKLYNQQQEGQKQSQTNDISYIYCDDLKTPILKNTVKENVQEELEIMYENNFGLVDKRLKKMRKHILKTLKMYAVYRSKMFQKEKDNIQNRKQFVKVIDDLSTENSKYIENVTQTVSSTITHEINHDIKDVLNLLVNQLDHRDQIISKLRHELIILHSRIEQFNDSTKKKQHKLKVINEELRMQLKFAKMKYNELEQRRTLEVGRFQNNIGNLRERCQELRTNHSHNKLKLDDIRKVEMLLYSNSY